MKPSLQQQENLKTYLRKELRYRETYEEVYDHILTALEQKPDSIPFQNLVNQIIKDDFGGGKSLLDMEKKCYNSVADEADKQQWYYFKSNFKYQNLGFNLILFLIVYLSILKIPFAPFIIAFLVVLLIVVPVMIRLARYFYIGYFTLDTKSSIKDEIMAKIAGRSFLLLNPGIMFFWMYVSDKNKNINFNSYIANHAFLVSIIVSLFILYVIAFIKLSKQELKAYIIK